MGEEGISHVDIGLIADWKHGDLQVLEPAKCEGWDWYDMNDLPTPFVCHYS